MRILAIDPGITTGVALVNEVGNVLHVADLQPEEISELEELKGEDLSVIIECTPTPTLSPMNRQLGQVMADLYRLFPDHVQILPGTWKSTPILQCRVPTSWHGKKTSRHVRDALKIAIYYLTFLYPGEEK